MTADHLSRSRHVIEIDFGDSKQTTKVADFPAYDFFGDGSFYLLDTPGHAIGHMGALARTTTSPPTFIFLGGDLSHHGGQLRPSKYLHIPAELSGPSGDAGMPCRGSSFEKLLSSRTSSIETPFFLSAASQIVDEEALATTRSRAQIADAQENIWLLCAHDPTISTVVDFFPASLNDWKAKGWRSKSLWSFLYDFCPAINTTDARPPRAALMKQEQSNSNF